MGFNGSAVILNTTTEQMIKHKSSRAMVNEIMREVIQGARACEYDIEDNFAEIMLNATQQMVDYSPSMKLDYYAGRPLEIDSIYWRPIQEAANHGFDMQKSKILAYQLDFFDRLNKNNI